jgi:Cu/Ag efflux protein CusF
MPSHVFETLETMETIDGTASKSTSHFSAVKEIDKQKSVDSDADKRTLLHGGLDETNHVNDFLS